MKIQIDLEKLSLVDLAQLSQILVNSHQFASLRKVFDAGDSKSSMDDFYRLRSNISEVIIEFEKRKEVMSR